MEVTTLESMGGDRFSGDQLVCVAARNDYMTEWVGDLSFEEIMEDAASNSAEEFIDNLVTRGEPHFGPFEHPYATFAIKGVSRVCMAQITRHRHATFDVQSQRYTIPNEDTPIEETVKIPPSVKEAGNVDEFLEACERQYEKYFDFIDEDKPKKYRGEDVVPAEDARMMLPTICVVLLMLSGKHVNCLMH